MGISQARPLRRLALLVVLVVVAVATVPAAEARPVSKGRVTYVVTHEDPRLVVSGTFVARPARHSKKRRRVRVVLQQLVPGGEHAWRDRAHRTVRQEHRKAHFSMRWRPSAKPEIVTLRVLVFSKRRLLARGARKFVPVK